METSLTNRNHFNPWKKLKRSLATGLRDSYSLLSFSEPLSQLGSVVHRMTTTLPPKMLRVFASQGLASLASTAALVKSATLNNRIYLAFAIFCASPFAATIHMPFERSVKYEWMGFIENWFHLFNMIGPYLFCLVVLSGVCLLIPPRQHTFKVFKVSLPVQLTRMMTIPIGFCAAKILWLCSVESNDDFWTIPGWSFCVAGLAFGYSFYRAIEWLTWRKFHAYDGLIATLEGAMNAYLPPEIKSKMEPLIHDLKQFNSKY